MISILSGKIIDVGDDNIVLLTSGGVGYDVSVQRSIASRVLPDQEITLYCKMVVSETSMQLFGFLEKNDKLWHAALCKIQKIGAKTALAIMDLGWEEFCYAVINKDAKAIERAKGIGKAGAQRIVMDMADFVNKTFEAGVNTPTPETAAGSLVRDQFVQSAMGLGYKKGDAVRWIESKGGVRSVSPEGDVSAVIKVFLKEQAPAVMTS